MKLNGASTIQQVVLEGCNGVWAREHYLPFLANKAAEGSIKLLAVDVEREVKLSGANVASSWRSAASRGNAVFINKRENESYHDVMSAADLVLVVTPDRYHCSIARSWLSRLTEGGAICIEKPLDATVEAAAALERSLAEAGMTAPVYSFDHYLARIYPFLTKCSSYMHEIGTFAGIRCRILESHRIPPERASTLDTGAIPDLFCHVLALVCGLFSQDTACTPASLQTIRLEKVAGARFAGSPISGETFARLEFTAGGGIGVVSDVGYCVGEIQEKHMVLTGARGSIELDFAEDVFSVLDSDGQQVEKGQLLPNHVERFLDDVLSRNGPPLLLPGVIGFDAALDILTMLDTARSKVIPVPEYRCGDSPERILERL